MSLISVKAAGKIFTGWQNATISAGIEQAARGFVLGAADRWPDDARIPRGSAIEVLIDDEPVVTGWVDSTPMEYDAHSMANYSIVGRSKTGDLRDCSAERDGGQWIDATIEQIARDLAAPFGVSVVVEAGADAGDPIKLFALERGETVQQAIDRAIGTRSLLVTDDPAGNLVLRRAGTTRSDGRIELSSNVMAASSDGSDADRFSLYRVYGQRSGSNGDHGIGPATPRGEATDPAVTRYRPLIQPLAGQVTEEIATEYANWLALAKFGDAYAVTYTVQGWRTYAGALWTPGDLVPVIDGVQGYDLDMVIVEVQYTLGEDGEQTVIRVVPPAAFEKRPDVPKATTGKTGGASSNVPAGKRVQFE